MDNKPSDLEQDVKFSTVIPSVYWWDINSRLFACENYLLSNEPMKAYRELLHAREAYDKAQSQVRTL